MLRLRWQWSVGCCRTLQDDDAFDEIRGGPEASDDLAVSGGADHAVAPCDVEAAAPGRGGAAFLFKVILKRPVLIAGQCDALLSEGGKGVAQQHDLVRLLPLDAGDLVQFAQPFGRAA